MLLYVESKAFPFRTFVIRIQPYETIARVRAQILHVLYELGHDKHQFRLRFNGQYLRDAFTIEDYAIMDSAIVKMVPLSRKVESWASMSDMKSDGGQSSSSETIAPGLLPDVKDALEKEIGIFDRREKLLHHFKGLLYLHFLAIWLSFLTTYWYSGIWTAVVWAVAARYCPTFTRMAGFIGRHSIYKTEFCVVYGMLALANAGASIYLCTHELIRIVDHGCPGGEFKDDCSHQVVYSIAFFATQAVCLLISATIAWILLWNMKVEYGDYVEKYLVQTRDIEEVMKAARIGSTKERRIATFELATMAASGDDNKFRIVAEGGLEVLIRMALSKDPPTQEHAVEAITELLTVPVIQDNFVEIGGLQTLTALLHSKDHRLVYQAAAALSYIVSDTEENKDSVISDHGLNDLAHAASVPNIACQRLIAGIFLELAFSADIRVHMASMNTPAKAMITLCKSNDPETQRLALQTLELLAIESSDMICAQEDLLTYLLHLPLKTVDNKVYLLAGKLLLYYAENKTTCEMLQEHPMCHDALSHYARTNDTILQKVVAKVIFCMLEERELRYRASHLELDEILEYIRDHAADREAWDMADQGLQAMNGDPDALSTLPGLSTMEKLQKMDAQSKADHLKREIGSRSSLRSRLSLRSSLSGSSADMKKGIN